MVNKINLLSDSEFAKLISNCYSISDVLKSLGYSVNGNSWGFRIVKERMEKLGLFFIKKPKDLHSALTKDSSYNRTKLKERLFKEGLKEYKCELCGISEWNGKPLSLQLHHINGVNNDNRLSNLQILCPNCHSQTDNFSSKGKGTSIIRKADNLSRESVELIMNTVREYGIVEARKRLTFRNSLINAVVKYHRDIIVMITPDNSEKEFATTVEAARYIFNTLHKGTSVESVRSRISDCLSGKQKTTAGGYKFYRRSIGV